MPSIFDYSSALPWFISGLVAGFFIYWLFRKISGVDSRRLEELASAQSALGDARRNASEMTNKASSLEAEWARLTNENGQLQQRAALVPQIERQLADIQQSTSARTALFDSTNKQLAGLRESSAAEVATLRQELEAQSGTAKYYENEFNRLHSEQESAAKNTAAIAADLQRTKAGLDAASRDANEVVQIRSQLASAKAENEALRAEIDQLKMADTKQAAAANQASSTTENKLKADLAAAQADIVALRADLDQRRKADGTQAEEIKRLTFDYEGKLKSATSAHAALSADLRKSADDLERLKAQASTAPVASDNSGELARWREEAAKQAAALENAKMEHHATKTDLQQVRTALEETSRIVAERRAEIEQLKAKLSAAPAEAENYRRFKDALDAANRIAAGLPEKT
jgi:chromosome segregation ATPase